MALRALQGPAGGSAPVGGTGTTNTIPRWTGPTTLGDSVITQSGAVGAQTITIARPHSATVPLLALMSTAGLSEDTLALRVGVSSPANYYFDFTRSVVTGALLVQGNQTSFNNICLAPTSGNVGIGTASPTGRLHVVGGTAAASTNGAPITIVAQSGGTGNTNGGDIVLTPGALSGTGIRGSVQFGGRLLAGADDTYDIGASGASRPRIVYVGTGVVGGYIRAGAASAGVASTTTIGNGTSTTATAGAQTLPANPLGFIIAHVGTTEVRIPYYAV